MGNTLRLGKKEVKVFMPGIGNTGRTTILYHMKTLQPFCTIPTIGFNVETISHKNINFTFFDVGGGDRIRLLWRHYQQDVKALVVVIDSSDLYGQEEFQASIIGILPYLPKKNLPFLIMANKKDKCKHTDEEILRYVGVNRYGSQIKYHLIHTNGISGEGLQEALDWLADQFQS